MIDEIHGLQRVKKRGKNSLKEYFCTRGYLRNAFSKNGLIWGFHSHPNSRTCMSAEDREYLKSSGFDSPLEIIVSVNKSELSPRSLQKNFRECICYKKLPFFLDYRSFYLEKNGRIYVADTTVI